MREEDNRIEEALGSLKGIRQAEANVYTFDNVMLKLQNERVPHVSISRGWIAGMVLVVAINTGVALYSIKNNGIVIKENYYKELESEMGYTNDYNYQEVD